MVRWTESRIEKEREREGANKGTVGAEETTARAWQKEGKKRWRRRSLARVTHSSTPAGLRIVRACRGRERNAYDAHEEIGEKERGDNLSSPRREEERWRERREVRDERRRSGCRKGKKSVKKSKMVGEREERRNGNLGKQGARHCVRPPTATVERRTLSVRTAGGQLVRSNTLLRPVVRGRAPAFG